MHGYYYYNRKAAHRRRAYLQRRYEHRLKKHTTKLPPNMNIRPRRNTHSLHSKTSITSEVSYYPFPAKRELPEKGTGSISLTGHILFIVLGTGKLFKDIPPRSRFVCIVLSILALVVLSSVVGIMVQVIAQVMNLVYIILGIAASAVTVEVWRQPERR
jgi:hypothetical protein